MKRIYSTNAPRDRLLQFNRPEDRGRLQEAEALVVVFPQARFLTPSAVSADPVDPPFMQAFENFHWFCPVPYYLTYPAPSRARCVESSSLVLVVVHILSVPVYSLPVSGVLSITIHVNQLQQDQNFVLKRLICPNGSPRKQRRRPWQAVHESDQWEGTVIQIVYFQVLR